MGASESTLGENGSPLDAGDGPAASTTSMDIEQIRERLLKEKDHLFEQGRAWREGNPGPPMVPIVGALLPDGGFSTWSLGGIDIPWPVLLQKVSTEVKDMGAVAAMFFGDGGFEAVDDPTEQGRSLFCYLTSTNWEELWVRHYYEGAEGLVWEEIKTVTDFAIGMGFSPFPQAPIDWKTVH